MEIVITLIVILFVIYYLFRPTSKKELDKFKDKDNWSNMGFWKEKMKKIFLTLIILAFASSAYAGSCPMLAGKVQNKIEEAKKLHDEGINAHKSGNHTKSEELLNKALELFKS